MPSTLLATKLHRPHPTSNLVSRPRLIQRLYEGLSHGHRLFLIAAPAGYGKTTLVTEWLDHCSVPAAWLSLDAGDNDPQRFFTYISAALAKALGPGVCQPLPETLPLAPPQPEAFVHALINDLATLNRPVLLALDDYHVIISSQIQAAVAFLLENAPPALRLVVLTRSDPPFPLSRLRVRQQMTEIRDQELRFTQEEMAAFLNSLHRLNLPATHVAALQARTEGWAAGVQLAALSLQGCSAESAAAFIDAFSGSHHHVVDYLFDEVLSRQRPEVRDFVIRTSLLDRMCASLCDSVLVSELPDPSDAGAAAGPGDAVALPGGERPPMRSLSGQILARLEHSSLFLVSLDDERRWYRYHHLFSGFLRQVCVSALPAGEIAAIHSRAGQWYNENGFAAEAYRHALLAGDHREAAGIVEEQAWTMVRNGELTTLRGWVESLPDQAITERPWLRIYLAWALVLEESDGAETQLQAAERQIQASAGATQQAEMSSHVAAIRAWIAYGRGDPDQAERLSRQALGLYPQIDASLRGALTVNLGDGCLLRGDFAGCARAYAEAADLARSSGNVMVEVLSRTSLGSLSRMMGRLHEAAATFQAALDLALRSRSPVAGQAYACLARLHREWNDLASAKRSAEGMIEYSALWGIADLLACGRLFLATLAQAQNDAKAASEALEGANRVMHEHPLELPSRPWLESTRAALWLAQGRLDEATGWAETRGLRIEGEFDLRTEVEYLAFVRILLAQHRVHEAVRLLSRLESAITSTGRQGDLIGVLVLQSVALGMQGQTASALAASEQALVLAQPEGYMRVFLDAGKTMEALLRAGVTTWKEDRVLAHARKVLAAWGNEAAAQPAAQAAHAAILSDRELELLRLIAAGRSNNQIAAELVIALGTVKRHTANIFDRLDVHSRTEAAAEARRLGLL